MSSEVLDISEEVQLTIFQKEVLSREVRYEQIGNLIYLMAFPSKEHQRITKEFLYQLETYLRGKSCEVFQATTGLDLSFYAPELKEKDTLHSFFSRREEKNHTLILDPDVMVICDDFKDNHSSTGFKVVPRLIVEVLSPSMGTNDLTWKKDVYEAVGVQKYWIINKDKKQIIRFNLKDNKYSAVSFLFEDIFQGIPSLVFPDLLIKFDKNKNI